MLDLSDEDTVSLTALTVLRNAFYFKMIASFQNGLPKLLHEFALQRHPNWKTMSTANRLQRLRRLGVDVIQHGDVRLLELVSRVRYQDSTVNPMIVRDIPVPVKHTIAFQRPDMLRWVLTRARDPYADPHELWNATFAQFAGNCAILDELNVLVPLPVSEFGDDEAQEALASSLLDIQLLRWTHDHLNGIKLPSRLLCEAAGAGNLDVVQFLHEQYPSATWKGDLYYQGWRSGSLEVLEYLLKNRTEPYSDRFLEALVVNRCLNVLEMVRNTRVLRVEARTIELARTCGNAMVESFLLEYGSPGPSRSN